MTMSSAVSKVTLNGDGVQTSWPFAFKVWKAADLEVSITNAAGVTTVVSNWSVSLADTGGTVTSPTSGSPLPSGHKITIARSMDFLQDVDLVSGTRWDPEVVETALDIACAERQQLKEKLSRAVTVDIASGITPEALRDSIFAARDTAVSSAASALDSAELAEQAVTTVAYYNHEGTLLSGEDTISLPWAYDTQVGVEVYLSGVKQAQSGLTFVDAYTVRINAPVSADTTFEVVATAGARSDLANTLLAPSGSNSVGFLQSGTGAVARTVQDKLRDFVSVKDFGAVGDGVADDTVAFAKACATGGPVFVPAGSYEITALTDAHKKRLFGFGVVRLAGTRVQISSEPFIDNDSAHVRVYNPELQPSKWPSVDGSLRNGAVSINATRTGGFGSYGLSLTEYLVADSIPAGEFDVGVTSWVTAQNVGGGQVFGAWVGANTPSSALSQTFTSGAAIGQETNVGNRWGDFGLVDDIGSGRYTVGHQIVPDVLPALDDATVAVYPGSFGEVLAQSIHGHKWWTGYLVSSDAIQPGGRVFNIRGGSVVDNAAGVLLRATDFFTRGIDFSGATISTQAVLLGTNHTISWGAGGGTTMSGTATTFGLSTGTGTGEGGLFANNYAQQALRWSSTGNAARLGFFGAAAVTRRTVSGSKGGNDALASLIAALSELGLITDTTT